MIFSQVPKGADIFLDTNTLVYHFGPDAAYGNACTDLLVRIKRQEIAGHTSTHVLAEMAHRLMTLEAMQYLGRSASGIASWLRKKSGRSAETSNLSAGDPGNSCFRHPRSNHPS